MLMIHYNLPDILQGFQGPLNDLLVKEKKP